MMTPLARFLAHATGPGRLRAALRRKTRAVRTYRRTFVSLHQVYAAIPHSVLGGDMLGLLSGRLRAVLENREAPVATPARGPAIRPGFASRLPVDRSNRESFLSPMLRGQGDRKEFDPVAATLGRSQQPFTVSPWRRRNGRPFAPPPAPTRRHMTPEGAHPPFAANSAVMEGGGQQSVSPRQPKMTAGTIFSQKLEEYWQLSAEMASPEQGGERVALSTKRDHRGATGFPDLPDGARGAHAWPEMIGPELAERIHAFVAGQGSPLPSTSQPQPQPPSNSGERVEIQNVFHIAVNADGTGAMPELSETLADILRQQAIQHGIDIT